MNNILIYIITPLILLSPYKYLEQDNVNAILFFIISIFAMFVLKDAKGNKKYGLCLSIMMIVSILSLRVSSITIESLQGTSLYISAFILYFILVSLKEEKEKILKVITYIMAGDCLVYMVVQGAFYNGGLLEGRIDGNIGYANTFALLMLSSAYFNRIRIKDNLRDVLELIFISGIFLTGSRNTLLYLGLFVVFDIVYKSKKENSLSLDILFNCIIAVFMYLIISKFRLGGILLLPLILILYYEFVNEENQKSVNIAALIMIPVGLIAMFSLKSSLLTRISSASINSSELQQRIGYLEDVVSYVFKNPFGGGINTFMYNQGSFQSGFYDVRYVHNSFGQAFYDMGFLGLIAFTALFIVGIVVILKGRVEKRFYYLALYLTIYFHSLLDFDFAYLAVLFLLVMIIAFAGNSDFTFKLNVKYINCILSLAGAYILLLTAVSCIGDRCINSGSYEAAVEAGKILDKFTFKDNNSRLLKYEAFNGLYNSTGDESYLYSGIKALEKGNISKNKKAYVYGRLGDAYAEAGDIEKSKLNYEKEIELEKYAPYPYSSLCNMLTIAEKNTGIDYSSQKNEIMNRYQNLEDGRSEKSKRRFQ